MSNYFIGDIHGCYNNLRSILDHVSFDPNFDTLHLTGDLVSRGPYSLEVLRLIRSLNTSAKMVLGNHDLHLLKSFFNVHHEKCNDNFYKILNAPDSDELINWLCNQPILHIDETKKILMSHAGIHPKWDFNTTKYYAKEIESILKGSNPDLLFNNWNKPNKLKLNQLNIQINQIKKIQYNLDVFTRMRYLRKNGYLDFTHKDSPESIHKNIYPWFNLPKFITPIYSIIFGHWATLKNIRMPSNIYGLDSGCCWGGHLTLLRWEDKKMFYIPCSPPR